MTSTLIGFAAALSAVIWAVVVWLVAVALRDDRRRDDLDVRPGPRMVSYGDVRARRDAPAPPAPPAERDDEPIVVTPPVAPAPMEPPAPMVEVADSDAGAWERLITLHRAENAGSE